jgi:hypothetical protein
MFGITTPPQKILSMEEIAKPEEFYNFLHFEPLRIPFQGN